MQSCIAIKHTSLLYALQTFQLKLASYRNQLMDLLSKPTDWFLNYNKFYRQVIFKHNIIVLWSILNYPPVKHYTKLVNNKVLQ